MPSISQISRNIWIKQQQQQHSQPSILNSASKCKIRSVQLHDCHHVSSINYVHNLCISNYTLLFDLCNDFRGCKVCVVSQDRSPCVPWSVFLHPIHEQCIYLMCMMNLGCGFSPWIWNWLACMWAMMQSSWDALSSTKHPEGTVKELHVELLQLRLPPTTEQQ